MTSDDILSRLADFMRKHKGKRNAVSSKEIGRIFKLRQEDTHAEARELIRQLIIKYDLPIIGGGKGYYIAETQNEVDNYVAGLDSRVKKMEYRKKIVAEAFNKQQAS